MSKMIAAQHPRYSRLVMTPKGAMTKDEALNAGYEILSEKDYFAALDAPAPVVTVSEPQPAPIAARRVIDIADVKVADEPIPAPADAQTATWHPVLGRFAVLPCGRVELAESLLAAGWEIKGEPACGALELSARLGLKGEHAVRHAKDLRQALAVAQERADVERNTAAILALPEARQRPAAAAKLAAAWPAERMTMQRAASWLRALPPETGDSDGAPVYTPRSTRFNERRYALEKMRLAAASGRGDKDAEKTLDACAYAEAVHRSGRMSLPEALSAVGLKAEMFERDGGADV